MSGDLSGVLPIAKCVRRNAQILRRIGDAQVVTEFGHLTFSLNWPILDSLWPTLPNFVDAENQPGTDLLGRDANSMQVLFLHSWTAVPDEE